MFFFFQVFFKFLDFSRSQDIQGRRCRVSFGEDSNEAE